MPGQTLDTVSISEFTDTTMRTWVGPNTNFVERGNAAKLYIYDAIPYNTGVSKVYQEIDVSTFATLKLEGADASKATVQRGYSKTMTLRRFAKEIDITWEERMQNRNPEVMTKLTNLAHFCPNRMELDLTHRLTFATGTSYTDQDGVSVTTTVGDGLALVSAVHTLSGSSTTFSNVITGNPTFSKGGLEIAELQANTQILTNGFAERRIFRFNYIVSSDDPTTVNDVKTFLMSITDVDQNNPGVVNVYKGKYQHLILPYLATTAAGAYDSTKNRYWGIVAAGQGVNGWQAYFGVQEQPRLLTPAPGNNGEDIHNDNWTYGTRCTFGVETVGSRGFVFSTGLGA